MKFYFKLLILSTVLCVFNPLVAISLDISSEAFKSGDMIPRIHACKNKGGQDKSIPVKITNVPASAKSLVLIIDDPDARPVAGKTWVHWNLSDIPKGTQNIPSSFNGSVGLGVNGTNSSNRSGYQGMCPPNGQHKYYVAVYAVSKKVGKLHQMTREKFEKQFGDIIINKAEFFGRFF